MQKNQNDFYVNSNGCSLYCSSIGEGPVLILIHGAGSDHHFFDDAASLLAAHYQVVTYDRCGHSRSVPDEGPDAFAGNPSRYLASAQAEDIRAIVDHLGEKQIYLAGVSAGGIIALAFAHRYPEAVRKLVLYEPALAVTEPYAGQMEQWLGELKERRATQKQMKLLLYFVDSLGGTDPEAPRRPMSQVAQDIRNLRIFLDYEMEDLLLYGRHIDGPSFVQVPLVIGAGSLGGYRVCSAAAQENAAVLGGECSVTEGFHNFAEERPAAFAAWLEGHCSIIY